MRIYAAFEERFWHGKQPLLGATLVGCVAVILAMYLAAAIQIFAHATP